jgi:hypothetical protein
MTAREFVYFLNDLAPLENEYPDEIKSIPNLLNIYKNDFSFKPKSEVWVANINPFVELYLNIDLSNKAIQDFCYLNNLQENDDYLKIGEGDSVDYLVVKSTGEIITLEAYNQSMEDYDEYHISSYVAASQGHFLEALSILYELYKLRIVKGYTIRDKDIAKPFIERCITAAGGEKYRNYYDN